MDAGSGYVHTQTDDVARCVHLPGYVLGLRHIDVGQHYLSAIRGKTPTDDPPDSPRSTSHDGYPSAETRLLCHVPSSLLDVVFRPQVGQEIALFKFVEDTEIDMWYADVSGALAWLTHAFGSKERLRRPATDRTITHAQLELNGGIVMLSDQREDPTASSPSSRPRVVPAA